MNHSFTIWIMKLKTLIKSSKSFVWNWKEISNCHVTPFLPFQNTKSQIYIYECVATVHSIKITLRGRIFFFFVVQNIIWEIIANAVIAEISKRLYGDLKQIMTFKRFNWYFISKSFASSPPVQMPHTDLSYDFQTKSTIWSYFFIHLPSSKPCYFVRYSCVCHKSFWCNSVKVEYGMVRRKNTI